MGHRISTLGGKERGSMRLLRTCSNQCVWLPPSPSHHIIPNIRTFNTQSPHLGLSPCDLRGHFPRHKDQVCPGDGPGTRLGSGGINGLLGLLELVNCSLDVAVMGNSIKTSQVVTIISRCGMINTCVRAGNSALDRTPPHPGSVPLMEDPDIPPALVAAS